MIAIMDIHIAPAGVAEFHRVLTDQVSGVVCIRRSLKQQNVMVHSS